MTWYYQIQDDNSRMDIYDHTGTNVQTLQNDGSGFSVPEDVHAVMRDVWEQEANLGSSPVMTKYAGEILMHMVTQDIEQGVP